MYSATRIYCIYASRCLEYQLTNLPVSIMTLLIHNPTVVFSVTRQEMTLKIQHSCMVVSRQHVRGNHRVVYWCRLLRAYHTPDVHYMQFFPTHGELTSSIDRRPRKKTNDNFQGRHPVTRIVNDHMARRVGVTRYSEQKHQWGRRRGQDSAS